MSKCTISLLGITYIYNLRFTKKTMFFFLVAKRPFRARNRVLAAISLRQRRSNRGSPPPPPPSSFAEGSQSPPPSLLPPPPFLLSLYFLPPPSLSVFCSIQKRESFASTLFSKPPLFSGKPPLPHPYERRKVRKNIKCCFFFVRRVRLDTCKAPNTAPAKGNVG